MGTKAIKKYVVRDVKSNEFYSRRLGKFVEVLDSGCCISSKQHAKIIVKYACEGEAIDSRIISIEKVYTPDFID